MNELQPRLIDTFLFHDELDLLEIRLQEMSPHVSLFVLVEAAKTHTGEDKPYYYEESKERFKDFNDKILHIKVEDMPDSKSLGDFGPEIYQRSAIGDAIHYLHTQNNLTLTDLILISDVDEIPFMEDLMVELEHGIATPTTLCMEMRLYYLNMRKQDKLWKGTVLVSVQELIAVGSQWFRDNRFDFNTMLNGWHFTYVGGWEKVKQKISTITDAKLVMQEQGLTLEDVEANFKEGIDLFSREEVPTYRVHELELPKYVRDNPELYPELLNAE
tara:strand:+ start:2076 stop:2891 length:816 start_codon:yes stop_codon:yes gene_type:complete